MAFPVLNTNPKGPPLFFSVQALTIQISASWEIVCTKIKKAISHSPAPFPRRFVWFKCALYFFHKFYGESKYCSTWLVIFYSLGSFFLWKLRQRQQKVAQLLMNRSAVKSLRWWVLYEAFSCALWSLWCGRNGSLPSNRNCRKGLGRGQFKFYSSDSASNAAG